MIHLQSDFPQLSKDVIYLDSAASSLTPLPVLEAMNAYYTQYRANIHRGMYPWSMQATESYEDSRKVVADFIGASQTEEVVFTRGTTDSVNMLARMLESRLKEGQKILIPVTEHHSNMLPWREVADRRGLEVVYIPLKGEVLDEKLLQESFDDTVALVVLGHVSNVLGTIHSVKTIAQIAHINGALCVVDGAQAIAHLPVSMQELGIDAYAFSGHKAYGPTGIGVLWVAYSLLETLNPERTGGDMVEYVSLDSFGYAPIPQRFEPGTPPIAEAIGLAEAIRWIQSLGWETIQSHEHDLVAHTWEEVSKRPWLRVLGGDEGSQRIGCFSFLVDGIHSHDVGHMLAKQGICVRAGQHCASGITETLGIAGSTRASYALHTTRDEVDALMKALDQVYQTFQ